MQQHLANAAARTTALLEGLLPPEIGDAAALFRAMRYSSLNAGKRLRPFLVIECARICGGNAAQALRVAAAVEMVHCYSLIHDDLPAMDNSDLRRGLPTCHKKFDEATAILAGDALLTQAFGVLADAATYEDANVRCTLIAGLASAAGERGMIMGQMLDMAAEKQPLSLDAITRLHSLKTGALIQFSCKAGAVVAGATAEIQTALEQYGAVIGKLFQLTDDMLDITGNAGVMGKPQHQDAAAGKASIVHALGGLAAAQQYAATLSNQAIECIELLGERAERLKQLTEFVINRQE